MRHGATDWNRDGRFQGQSDIPLNAEGRAQAGALARALQSENFDYAVSSDLSRALDTARAICGIRPVAHDARWREFAFGEWEGLTWEQIAARWPAVSTERRTSPSAYAPPGGETFAAVSKRVASALEDLRSAAYGRVLVVTHAGPLHAMLRCVFGESPQVRFMPASITRIELDGPNAALLDLNDVSHL